MKYRRLGRTGLKVAELCLGTMQWGWTATEEQAFQVMDAYFEAGGNFIDTADIYSAWAEGNPGGVSEGIIGRWLKARGNRTVIVLATKLMRKMWEGANGGGLSRVHVQQVLFIGSQAAADAHRANGTRSGISPSPHPVRVRIEKSGMRQPACRMSRQSAFPRRPTQGQFGRPW